MTDALAAPVVRLGRAVAIGGICLAGLSGCVTPVAEQFATLENASVCCTSMSEFKYVPLVIPEEKEVTLGTESPSFVFPAGKSFFAAYRLPPWTAPYQIRGEAQSGNARGGLFAPSALMLDAEFRITREFNAGQSTAPNARPGIVHIFVNEPNRDEQYLVLFTSKLSSPEGVNTLVASPVTMAIGAVPVQIGATESRTTLRYAPAGTLQLKVSPYQPARANQAANPG